METHFLVKQTLSVYAMAYATSFTYHFSVVPSVGSEWTVDAATFTE